MVGTCTRDIFFSNSSSDPFIAYWCDVTCPIESDNTLAERGEVVFDFNVNRNDGIAFSGTARLGNPQINVAIIDVNDNEITRDEGLAETELGTFTFTQFLANLLAFL